MQVLFGAADRDLLQCYRLLLTDAERTVETAFDGAQVLTKLASQRFDLLILERGIPRVGSDRIVAKCVRDGLPVIELLPGPLTTQELLAPTPANAYLSHPFLPAELEELIDSVLQKTAGAEVLQFEGFAVYPAEFSLETLPVTAGELDVLSALHAGQAVRGERQSVFIRALNARMTRLGLRYRIRYQKNTGYRMVTEDE